MDSVKAFSRLLNDLEMDAEISPDFAWLALDQFVELVSSFKKAHVRKKPKNLYLAEKVFSVKELFDISDYRQYCRGNLYMGAVKLASLVDEIKAAASGTNRDVEVIKRFKDVLHDYLFDLKWVIDFLEGEKRPGFRLFDGGKSVRTETFHVYHFSRSLAYSAHANENVLSHFHKEAQTVSAFVLRQALELKFERAVNVDLRGSDAKKPRLKHGFHYQFMLSNPELFKCEGTELPVIKKIYDWCSHIVHTGHQPWIWQMPYAFDLCSSLFGWGDLNSRGGGTVFGGIRVMDVPAMQLRFMEHFVKSYDHGLWCMSPLKPEAADFTA